MTADELLAAYNKVAGKHGLPPMEVATTTAVHRVALAARPSAESGEDAWRFVRDLAPRSGWLQFQSRVVAFADDTLPEPAPDWGCLLAAEAVLRDGRSVTVGPDGRGALLAVVLRPEPLVPEADLAAAGAAPILLDRVRHRATGNVPGDGVAIYYARYWRADPERGLVPVVAAFTGFGPTED